MQLWSFEFGNEYISPKTGTYEQEPKTVLQIPQDISSLNLLTLQDRHYLALYWVEVYVGDKKVVESGQELVSSWAGREYATHEVKLAKSEYLVGAKVDVELNHKMSPIHVTFLIYSEED